MWLKGLTRESAYDLILLFFRMAPQVRELAESVLRDPVFLTVGTDNAGAANIDQRLVYVGKEEGKLLAIRQLVQDGLQPPVLIFLQSKDRAKVRACVSPNSCTVLWGLFGSYARCIRHSARLITMLTSLLSPTLPRDV